jgi:hypothetical protein
MKQKSTPIEANYLDDKERINQYFDKTLNHIHEITNLALDQIQKSMLAINQGNTGANTVRYLNHDYFMWEFESNEFVPEEDSLFKSIVIECLVCKSKMAHNQEVEESQSRDLFFDSFCKQCMSVKYHFYKFFSIDEYQEVFSSIIREKIRLYFDYRLISRRQIVLNLYQDSASKDEIIYQFKLMSIIPDFKVAGLDSILHLLDRAGVLDALNQKTGIGGYRSIASNGMACLSIGERMLVEYLVDQNIEFEKEPIYPKHTRLNPSGGMRADFKVKDLWVELAGMLNLPEYAARIEKKKQLAKVLGLNLLILKDYQKEDLNMLKSRINETHRRV